MSRYQLIAFDMDGTLLDSRKRIAPDVAAALKKACSLGKTVVISTGRAVPEMAGYREVLQGIRYMICVSGALLYDCREERAIHANYIEEEIIRSVLAGIRGRDIMVHFLGQGSVVEKDKVAHMDRYHMGIYRPLYEKAARQVEDIYAYFSSAPRPFEKMNLYHTSVREREISRAAFSHLPAELKNAEETSLEFSARGVNKGTGLRILCRHLGISLAETIAVGDADNDRDMLAAAGLSLAMGNADAGIKSLCDFVLPDNDHGGCAEAIEKYLLGEEVG